MTKQSYNLGILGYPLTHSLSPLLHQHFLEAANLTGTYQKHEIPEDRLQSWFQNLNTEPLDGFNVTIPYKTKVQPYLTTLTPTAKRLGAINTVTLTPQGLQGDNTDVAGILKSLGDTWSPKIKNARVAVIGLGGASRALADALMQRDAKDIIFVVRDIARAQPALQQIQMMSQTYYENKTACQTFTTLTLAQNETLSALFNASPVGMSPQIAQSPVPLAWLMQLPKTCLVYDLIYNPLQTQLMKQAQDLELPVMNGLEMLIYQGAAAFMLWTGQAVTNTTIQIAKDLLHQELNKVLL